MAVDASRRLEPAARLGTSRITVGQRSNCVIIDHYAERHISGNMTLGDGAYIAVGESNRSTFACCSKLAGESSPELMGSLTGQQTQCQERYHTCTLTTSQLATHTSQISRTRIPNQLQLLSRKPPQYAAYRRQYDEFRKNRPNQHFMAASTAAKIRLPGSLYCPLDV